MTSEIIPDRTNQPANLGFPAPRSPGYLTYPAPFLAAATLALASAPCLHGTPSTPRRPHSPITHHKPRSGAHAPHAPQAGPKEQVPSTSRTHIATQLPFFLRLHSIHVQTPGPRIPGISARIQRGERYYKHHGQLSIDTLSFVPLALSVSVSVSVSYNTIKPCSSFFLLSFLRACFRTTRGSATCSDRRTASRNAYHTIVLLRAAATDNATISAEFEFDP